MTIQTKIVFDFDGPIGNSKDLLLEFISKSAEADYSSTLNDLMKHFMTTKHSRDDVITDKEFLAQTEFGKQFVEFLKVKNNGPTVVPLFEEFVTQIRQLPQSQFGIISTGTSDYILPSIEHHQDIFPHVLCFNHHPSKVDKMIDLKSIMNYGINDNIVYVTDTLSDVLEFEDYLGLDNIYGVTWGVHNEEILSSKLEPSNILNNFEDIHRILLK